MSDIELLSWDDKGQAIPGPTYPPPSTAVLYRAQNLDNDEDVRLAYRHKFFRRDEHGRPIPGTVVAFLVPEHLCDGPKPSDEAVRLVADRMGWQ